MKATLIETGPAVLNGGTSTFLAFVALAFSSSYIFKTFFKIFFLVVVFGLYHGLVYLPVLLSLIGPKTSASGGHGSDNKVAPASPQIVHPTSGQKERF